MIQNPERVHFQAILEARGQMQKSDQLVGEALQRYLLDRSGTREECLLAFMDLQSAFQSYSSLILSQVGTLWPSVRSDLTRGGKK